MDEMIETLLLAFEDPVEAVDRSAAMLDLDPGFCLSDADVMRALVVAAADQEQPDLAMRFAENFLAVYPTSAKAPSGKVLEWTSPQGQPYWYRMPEERRPGRKPNLILMLHGTGMRWGWAFWNYPIASGAFRPGRDWTWLSAALALATPRRRCSSIRRSPR